jgi:lipopolysaccharide export system permease protein
MLFINEKIVFKKFLTQNTYFFLLSSISITFIVWTIRAVNNLAIVSEDGHSFLIYFYFTILVFPKIFSQVLPIVFFTSLFYNLVKYENNNELKIFWLNGINKINFFNVILRYTVLFFFIQIFLNTILSPYMQNKAREFIQNSNLDFFPSLFQEKKFIDTVEKLTIFIETKNSIDDLRNIYLKDDSGSFSRIVIAKKGQLISQNNSRVLRLYDGKFINIDSEGKSSSFNFDKTDFNISKFATKSTTYRKLQETSILELISCVDYILIKKEAFVKEYIICNKDGIREVITEIYKRTFKPFYLFLLSSIVIFLLISNHEEKKFKIFKFYIFSLGIILIIISEISVTFSSKSNLSLLISILLPLIIFLISYTYFYKKVNYIKNKK